jgi:hypothetical protein
MLAGSSLGSPCGISSGPLLVPTLDAGVEQAVSKAKATAAAKASVVRIGIAGVDVGCAGADGSSA